MIGVNLQAAPASATAAASWTEAATESATSVANGRANVSPSEPEWFAPGASADWAHFLSGEVVGVLDLSALLSR